MVTIEKMHHMERVVMDAWLRGNAGDIECAFIDMTVAQLEAEFNRIMDVPIVPIRAKNQCNKGEE